MDSAVVFVASPLTSNVGGIKTQGKDASEGNEDPIKGLGMCPQS